MIKKLSFSVTHDCPISCKYCVTRSGPKHGPFLDAAFMKEAIDALTQHICLGAVIFTGGEPLLHLDDVVETIAFAHERGLWTRVVTNGFWAKTQVSAETVLTRLVEAGLGEMNVSCDDLHQEHLPAKSIYNAFWGAKAVHLPILLAHKKVVNAKITPEYLNTLLGVELQEFKAGEVCGNGANYYSSSLTVPIGTGTKTLNEADYILYPGNICAWSAPCGGVLDGLIISPTKEVHICCGMMEQYVPELSIGMWDSKRVPQIIYDANTDLMANWLALEGPYGLMKLIQEKAPEIEFKDDYVNNCHLCNSILTRPDTRAVLTQYAEEKNVELGLRRAMLEALRYVDKKPQAAPQAQSLPARAAS